MKTMNTPKVFESEYRFCLILWEHEPIKSTELAKLCESELGWKKATTYTVIKRLTERGIIKSENAVITSLVTKSDVQAAEVNEIVEKTFEGNVPQFLAAFSRSRKLSKSEIDEIQKMIDEYKE
jgi:predicted transcriptional regulator